MTSRWLRTVGLLSAGLVALSPLWPMKSVGAALPSRPILLLLWDPGQTVAIDPRSGTGRFLPFPTPILPRWDPAGRRIAWYWEPEGERPVGPEARWTAPYDPVTGRFCRPRAIPQPRTVEPSGSGGPHREHFLTLVPAWSPDGKWLMFGAEDLYCVSARSGRDRTLLSERVLPRGRFCGWDWTRDGKEVAYGVLGDSPVAKGDYDPEEAARHDAGRRCDLYVADLRTRRSRRIGTGSRPRFSRDGRFLLALDRYRERFGLGLKIYDLRRRGNAGRWLVHNALAGCFAPDGRRVVAVLASGALVEVDLDGGVVRTICNRKRLESVLETTLMGPIKRADVDW